MVLTKGESAFGEKQFGSPSAYTDPNSRMENFGRVTFSVALTSVETRPGDG